MYYISSYICWITNHYVILRIDNDQWIMKITSEFSNLGISIWSLSEYRKEQILSSKSFSLHLISLAPFSKVYNFLNSNLSFFK